MTVRDLIEELEEMPMDLPVISDFKEITDVTFEENLFYLDESPMRYTNSAVIVLS